MQILYGYSNCTDQKYNEIVSERNAAVLQPDQKYHGLLIKGLARNGATVRCYSGLPINRVVTSRKWIHEKDETEGNAYFHYYTTLNIPVIRQIMIFFAALINILKVKKEPETFAIFDCLNIANAYGMMIGCKLRKIPMVTIVTDLPDMMSESTVLRTVNNHLFQSVDGFVFLTEQMNQRLNHKKKPYIVLEGHVDADAPRIGTTEKWEKETGKKIIIYAGSILKLYGIQNLTEGFVQAALSDTELWVYGDGDYREELIEISKKYPSVVYKGVCGNQEVVASEIRAALLVNPRPVAPEYTKYSFPSKNMEYMVSGTPVLTTRLPGMPETYYPYVYILDDETPDGVAEKLREILSKPMAERDALAQNAREYVMQNKTNIAQAEKIMDFLRKKVS
jgi:glycosyltransferase involved in cell wall biosynthesis